MYFVKSNHNMAELLRKFTVFPTFKTKSKCDSKKNFKSGASMANHIDREKNVTTVIVNDLKDIPNFCIYTPTFNFDSHKNSEGWYLFVKQWRFGQLIKRTTVRLVSRESKDGINEAIRIRISEEMSKLPIRTVEDVATMFMDNFEIVHVTKLKVAHKPLAAYTEEELLAEVNRRTIERLKTYHKPSKRKVNYDNVIYLPVVKPVVVDEERLAKALAS